MKVTNNKTLVVNARMRNWIFVKVETHQPGQSDFRVQDTRWCGVRRRFQADAARAGGDARRRPWEGRLPPFVLALGRGHRSHDRLAGWTSTAQRVCPHRHGRAGCHGLGLPPRLRIAGVHVRQPDLSHCGGPLEARKHPFQQEILEETVFHDDGAVAEG